MNNNYVYLGTELTYEDLKATRSMMPAPTRSHVPIAHHDVYDLIAEEATNFGFELSNPMFGTSHDHQRMFGIVECQTDLIHPEHTSFLAFRNSHDKQFPASAALGKRVTVCSNLMFGGEVSIRVKHTTNIWDRIKPRFANAISKLAKFEKVNNERIDLYKNTTEIQIGEYDPMNLEDQATVDHFVCESMRRNVITSDKIKIVMKEFYEPKHDEFKPKTLWSLNNAYTEVFKRYSNPHSLWQRSQKLTTLCDMVCDAEFEDINAVDTVDEDVVELA